MTIDETDLADGKERFRLAFEFARVGMAMIDLEGNFFAVNQAFADITGYDTSELTRLNIREMWAPDERVNAWDDFHKAALGEQSRIFFERQYLHKSGSLLYAEVSRGLAQESNGTPICFIVTFRDITESKRLQALLVKQASTDSLTGAMNRARIEERAAIEMMRAERYGEKLSLVMIDLDRFKRVNDQFGHPAGDRVLQGFCMIALRCLRAMDLLGRWGGEEFVILLPATGIHGAQRLAERLRLAMEEYPFENGLKVTASIGVASFRKGDNLDSLTARVDAALYRAKQAGRNRVVLDAEDLEREVPAERLIPKMLNLRWRKTYQSGNELIDADHQALFHLTNALIQAVSNDGEGESVLDLANRLIVDTQAHFLNEENELERAGYPEIEEHRQCHHKLLEKANHLIKRYDLEQASGASELVGFLVYDLITLHILHEDAKFFSWLQTHQV